MPCQHTKKQPKPRVAVYIRVGNASQLEERSLMDQKDLLKSFCQADCKLLPNYRPKHPLMARMDKKQQETLRGAK